MIDIEGKYEFEITKKDNVYIAEVRGQGFTGWSSSRDKEKLFELIADNYMVALDIPSSGWNRFWHRLLRLK